MSRYQNGEDQSHQKELIASEHMVSDQTSGSSHFLSSDILSHQRALMAVTSGTLTPSTSSAHDTVTHQFFPTVMARSQTSPTLSSSSPSSYYSHHHHQALSQSDSSTVLLHRFTSADSSIPQLSSSSSALTSSSAEAQQRLALAYWQAAQAHTLGEIMTRSQMGSLTSETSAYSQASELAAIAAAAAATNNEDTRHLLSSLSCPETKIKVPPVHSAASRSHHHTREPSPSWNNSGVIDGESTSHQPTMLPETCIPVDMARSQNVANAEGTT